MDFETRIRNVTAVLGPTNTGKTHLAIERMLGHESGMIGLPLRLLAREVYDKIAARVGAEKVALVTGEEKIKPERARYWVATVEAMPREVDVDFLAIDEIQLAADFERGHVFTDRLLNARGRQETLLLGAQTMRDAIQELIPGANFISRPRLSKLTYAGEKKITRLPARTAVVAFSANEVYAIAELIRRQRGGTAVVLGALSPRTRNAQVALYQSGDVDFLVATDAIGMGLNLDVDHVAFSSMRKFDGQNFRNLTPSEAGQIAGRAGRHMNDGTFGVTGTCEPLEPDLVERLENHTFDPVRVLQWRNRNLEFRSLDALRDSLREMPREQRLTRARMADDVLALETVAEDREIRELVTSPAAVSRLWDVCQIPDYRKISAQNHAELVSTLYKFLQGPEGHIPEDWFAKQVALSDRTDGDIDTLSTRLAHIRTWTFVSNRADWLKDPTHWQGRTRAIEDSLSDALHECLTQRFVDARTSALMKGMRDKEELAAEIGDDGSIHVEKHFVGKLRGFVFTPETHADSVHGKAARHAASQVLSRELGMRARRVAAAKPDAFKLSRSGRILWRDDEIARLEPSQDPLKPAVVLLADEHLSQPDKEKVQARLEQWMTEVVSERLKPLAELAKAEDLTGLARGIAFRLQENLGVLKRETVATEIKSLDQEARAQLRKYGVRFGAFNIFFPLLVKPAAAELASSLWTLKYAGDHGLEREAMPDLPRPGLTSVLASEKTPEAYYRVAGYHACGPRAVRIDILERLADLIRALLAYRSSSEQSSPPPKGSTGDGGFVATQEMMSILGCSPDELGNVLKALGFRMERRQKKATTGAASSAAGSGAAQQETGEPATGQTGAGPATAPEAGEPSAAGHAEAAAEAPPEALDTGEVSAPAAAASSVLEDNPSETGGAHALAPAAGEAAADTEQWEEVWRPRRQRHEQHGGEGRGDRHRRHRGGGRGQHQGSARAAEGAGKAEAPVGAEGGAAGADMASAADQQRQDQRQDYRGERGGHRGRDREGRREREDSREQGRRPGEARQGGKFDRDRRDRSDRPGGGDRRDRRDQGRRREGHGGPHIQSAVPPKKGMDPNSPFASLGALREALEKRARDKST